MGKFIQVKVHRRHLATIQAGSKQFRLEYSPPGRTKRRPSRLKPNPKVIFENRVRSRNVAHYNLRTKSIHLNLRQSILYCFRRGYDWSNLNQGLGQLLAHEMRHAWQHQAFGTLLYASKIVESVLQIVLIAIILIGETVEFMAKGTNVRSSTWKLYGWLHRRMAYAIHGLQIHELDARWAASSKKQINAWSGCFVLTPINP